MDADTFKDRIQSAGYSYSEFAEYVGASLPKVKAVAGGRNKVPEEWIQKLEKPDTVPEPVTKSVTHTPYWKGMPKWGLMKGGQVVVPAPAGDWWDILDDGYARGYPGDDWMLRVYCRTPQAVMRGLSEEDRKAALDAAGLPSSAAGMQM